MGTLQLYTGAKLFLVSYLTLNDNEETFKVTTRLHGFLIASLFY